MGHLRSICWGLAWLIVCGRAAPRAASPPALVPLRVAVRADASVSALTLFTAKADVVRLFRAAQIDVQWTVTAPDVSLNFCDDLEPCARDVAPGALGRAVLNPRVGRGRVAWI